MTDNRKTLLSGVTRRRMLLWQDAVGLSYSWTRPLLPCKRLKISSIYFFIAQHVYFRQGTDEADVYPNTFWMPGTAVQVLLHS